MENHTKPSSENNLISTNITSSMNSGDQLDNLSNLLINSSWEDDVLDQYENETELSLNDHLQYEKDQSTQKLFQSFQTSACAVAQMFKDKTQPPHTPWESFQNSAGAITVLYKDSLEACKAHMELGISIGQQRKIKELINWLKKKKRRNIRKDELIAFLLGKQIPPSATSSSAANPSMFSMFSMFNSSSNYHPTSVNSNPPSRRQQQQQQSTNRNQTTSGTCGSNNISTTLNSSSTSNSSSNNSQPQTTTISNSSTNTPTAAPTTTTNSNLNANTEMNYSDLATFREALIMHNRTRVSPYSHLNNNNHHTNHHNSHNHNRNSHHHSHISHHNNHSHSIHSHNTANITTPANGNNPTIVQSANTTNVNQQLTSINNGLQPTTGGLNCDDLDCFFCEQIATHIEQKRSANFDMESPTRKRSRFY